MITDEELLSFIAESRKDYREQLSQAIKEKDEICEHALRGMIDAANHFEYFVKQSIEKRNYISTVE